jgi:hypothetical protein
MVPYRVTGALPMNGQEGGGEQPGLPTDQCQAQCPVTVSDTVAHCEKTALP